MRSIISLLLVVMFVSCSSTTTITSTDSKAKIYVDGEYKGTGVATHTDTKIVGSSTSVRISKKGCKDRTFVFSRSEEFDPGACAGGVFVLVPFLWVMKYKASRTYEYECEAN